jgi:hypothetical protein
MTVIFHPEFPNDIRKFESGYGQISVGLAARFREEVYAAVNEVKASPTSAGHFLNLGSSVVPEFRRRNLKAFPFFILYGIADERLIFGSVIPSKSDPLTWLTRFSSQQP